MRVPQQADSLVGELPRLRTPTVQRHIPQVGAVVQEKLGGAAGQRRAVIGRADEFLHVVEARSLAGYDHGMGQGGRTPATGPEPAHQRAIDGETVRYVEEGASREERTMQGGQLIPFRPDPTEKVRLHKFWDLPGSLPEGAENHTPGGKRGIDLRSPLSCPAL